MWTNKHTYKHYKAILEPFLSFKFWKDSGQNSDTATVHFGTVTTVPIVVLLLLLLVVVVVVVVVSSLVTGLFCLVPITVGWSRRSGFKFHTAVLSVLCVMLQVLLLLLLLLLK
jgi:flagellar biosynthesis protein FlhB